MKRVAVCLAYFGDGKFLGWYADSFGSIRKNSPKIYGNTHHQMDVIRQNFLYKIRKLGEVSDLGKYDFRLSLIDNSSNKDKDTLSQYKTIELRSVECPYYDGPDPDEQGKWIYADYSKVKEWADKEPTEFLETIIKIEQ